ncbi:signal peptide peptidase SppA [Marinivivus vitaminiproducens]|uniref:signal peptide peptidase SppA n=1 Tax=Marinivivus vitaminiproducens TaxID=3035935 RepID=UPI0027A6A1D5|nr:signal peptide peptidase SppA [Geminicoccaceae bacterium SCSIO 64248]
MKRLFVGCLATLGALVLVVVAAVGGALWYFEPWAGTALPERGYLTLDLRGGLPQAAPDPLLPFDQSSPITVERAVLALDEAAADPRITGLFALVDGETGGLARAQDLRQAVLRFRDAGKPAVAFADSFGELSQGTSGYYLASGFEQVTLQPHGLVGFTGIFAEVPLIRGLLDQVGVRFELSAREAYKTFRDTFTERDLTPQHREMLESITGDAIDRIVADIASSRGRSEADIRAAMERGPLLAQEALDAGLIDRIAYRDEAEAGMGPAEAVAIEDYAAAQDERALPDDAPTIALIQAVGAIQRGEGSAGGLGGFTIGADDLAEALGTAAEDTSIQAVLLAIDSPGGSAVASETIGRAVRLVREAGKPVVVAMGDAAASGGYWIAMDADAIYAQPGTLTGSIGVVAGKPVLTDLLTRLEVNVPAIGTGGNADVFSITRPYSPEGQARLEASLDAIYAGFLEGVARGRDMDPERARSLAQGRVWTGAQAAENGLADGLGGFKAALDDLKGRVGVESDAPVELRRLPAPLGTLERLRGFADVQALLARGLAMVGLPATAQAPLTGLR